MLLITGAAGYLGSKLVQSLFPEMAAGLRIRAIDDFSEGKIKCISDPEGKLPDVAVEKMDITCRNDVRRMMKDVETVVHFAAITGIPDCENDPQRANEVNLLGTRNIIEAGAGEKMRKILFPSSFAVYGNACCAISEETPTRPINYYGILKRATEDIIIAAAEAYGIDYVIFRQSNIHGRSLSRKKSLINKICTCVKNGEPLEMVGDGSQTRDFVFIDDVMKVYKKALASDIRGLYNLGSGECSSIKTVFDVLDSQCRRILGKGIKLIRRRKRLEGKKEVCGGFEFKVSRLEEAFGFRPRSAVEESIRGLLIAADEPAKPVPSS